MEITIEFSNIPWIHSFDRLLKAVSVASMVNCMVWCPVAVAGRCADYVPHRSVHYYYCWRPHPISHRDHYYSYSNCHSPDDRHCVNRWCTVCNHGPTMPGYRCHSMGSIAIHHFAIDRSIDEYGCIRPPVFPPLGVNYDNPAHRRAGTQLFDPPACLRFASVEEFCRLIWHSANDKNGQCSLCSSHVDGEEMRWLCGAGLTAVSAANMQMTKSGQRLLNAGC